MKHILALLLLLPLRLIGQSGSDTLHLNDLVREALRKNPEMKAFELNRDAMEARVGAIGTLDDPELTYMREEMPGFRWNESMMQKIELMQMIPFPGKLSTKTEIAEIQAEHAHHDHMEKANEVLAKLRSGYFELWYAQQSIALNRENARLLQQFTKIAQTRYGVGQTPQQDVLKAFVEIAKLDNQLVTLRQQELAMKSMLQALLNRPPTDTLGVASVPNNELYLPTQDTLQYLAQRYRGMLLHDSLSVIESEEMLSLAKKEYLPDFKVGVQYVRQPFADFRGWTVLAGINLPFTPWSLSRNAAMVEEANISIEKSQEVLKNSRNMVRANINELYLKAQSLRKQMENYARVIVPQTQQALRASMTAYQTGSTDFLTLIDSYRMLVELSMEKLMLRMQFEQAIAQLKREVGYAGIFEMKGERN
ncbi:MAG: TolC family protein [Ignavibacteriae bacterium]|nr:TolC family protein [Ignavibacteriota bacterium]